MIIDGLTNSNHKSTMPCFVRINREATTARNHTGVEAASVKEVQVRVIVFRKENKRKLHFAPSRSAAGTHEAPRALPVGPPGRPPLRPLWLPPGQNQDYDGGLGLLGLPVSTGPVVLVVRRESQ